MGVLTTTISCLNTLGTPGRLSNDSKRFFEPLFSTFPDLVSVPRIYRTIFCFLPVSDHTMEHTAHSHLDQTTKLALRSTYHYNFPPHLRLPQQNTAFILHNGFGKGSVGLSFLVPDAHAIHDGLRHSSSNQQYSAVCICSSTATTAVLVVPVVY